MKTLLLTKDDVQSVVRSIGPDRLMSSLIERLEATFRAPDIGREAPARRGFHYEAPVPGMVEWMPAMARGKQVLVKIVGYHPDNPAHEIPTVLSTMFAYNTTTGHLEAILDGTLLTAMRTGAASAVASRWMARPDSRRLGLIGCGTQAVTQTHALSQLFPLDEIWIYDIDPAAIESFPLRIEGRLRQGVQIRVEPPEAVVKHADIVSTTTSVPIGRGPVFAAVETKPWLHINGVGSDFPGKTELPRSLLEASFVCADMLEQACVEGECQQLQRNMIHADITSVASGEFDAGELQRRRTVFDSTGWALEDQVAADVVLEHARVLGVGTLVSIECFGDDPRDPYGFVRDAHVPALALSARSA